MKKMSDEGAAEFVSFIWIFFLYLAVFGEKPVYYVILLFVTIIIVLVCYYDWKHERDAKEIKRVHDLFCEQTEKHIKDIYEFDRKRRAENDR